MCYCPFHYNRDSPAFAVNKTSGLYICFNASCSAHKGGSLERLVSMLKKKTTPQARRIILSKGVGDETPMEELLDDAIVDTSEISPVEDSVVEYLSSQFWENPDAVVYMMDGRGFTEETLRYFNVGWDKSKKMVVVPIYDAKGRCINFNGRSISTKEFKIGSRYPRNKMLFNIHNAKRFSKVIITESQFDAMRVHQAGYPNAIATLGDYCSAEQLGMLRRYFTDVILFGDNDKNEAGQTMSRRISKELSEKSVFWATDGSEDWYPRGVKDACDMTDEEIKFCVQNCVSDFELNFMSEL